MESLSVIAQELDKSVSNVFSDKTLQGFEMAFKISDAIIKLKSILTTEYMKPIMAMQGNKLGFKSDKQYTEDVVKNCLIEAVLMGVLPYGNQFNIIAGNSYITKEGFGYLLSKIEGLKYTITPMLPRISEGKPSAAIVMKIEWEYNGNSKEKEIDIAVKVNNYMGTDAVIGKAQRKARAWLYNTVIDNGIEIADGDISDIPYQVVTEKPLDIDNKKEHERKIDHINTSTSLEQLSQVEEYLDNSEQIELFEKQKTKLTK